MSAIVKIPTSRWAREIAPIMRKEFDSDMPDPKSADFYGVYDEHGKLKSFVLTEKIVIVGQIWSRDSGAAKNDGLSIKKLIDFIVQKMPPGISVGAVASEKRFEGLYRLLKMQKITGTFFRRNL